MAAELVPVASAGAAVATGVYVITAAEVGGIVLFVSGVVGALYRDILTNRKADREKLDACESAHQLSNEKYIELAREVSELTGAERMVNIVREEIRAFGERK